MAEFEVGERKLKTPEIKPEHKKVLDKIRNLYIESGGEPLYKPEDFGINQYRKSPEGITVSFDYGVPTRLLTPEGSYTILGSSVVGDTKKFWDLFNKGFGVEVIKPKRNDKELREKGPKGELEYQLSDSGPLVRIKEKEE